MLCGMHSGAAVIDLCTSRSQHACWCQSLSRSLKPPVLILLCTTCPDRTSVMCWRLVLNIRSTSSQIQATELSNMRHSIAFPDTVSKAHSNCSTLMIKFLQVYQSDGSRTVAHDAASDAGSSAEIQVQKSASASNETINVTGGSSPKGASNLRREVMRQKD
jgi:hypothetical protein